MTEIVLMRHGATEGNLQKRYIGATDEPLCEAGKAALYVGPPPCVGADKIELVYVTPLVRTQQTAAICFPNAQHCVVPDLREMDFGCFEGKNYKELDGDAAYAAWLETNCEGACPGGESRAQFEMRTCAAFETLVREAAAKGERRVVIVAHGGTIMAVCAKYALPPQPYFAWNTSNGGVRILHL